MSKKKQKYFVNLKLMALAVFLMVTGLIAFFLAGAAGREYYYSLLDTDFCAQFFKTTSESVECSQSAVYNFKNNLLVSIGAFFASGALMTSSVFTAFLSTRPKN